MKVFVLIVGVVLLQQQEVHAGPIWDRARRMFGWDKPEEQGQNVALAPSHSYGGPQGYPASGPPQKSYGGNSGPGAYAAASNAYPQASAYPYGGGRGQYGRPEGLQHASSALYGSYASPSFAGASYAKTPYGAGAAANYGSYGGSAYPTADFGAAPSASNNYGGLFSVVDQTSQIGQLANGDLAAAPSEPYTSSNEDVMKSLLKMVDKPFDLEAAASAASNYYQQNAHLAFNPGPHPIMEAHRNIIRYRTSPIQIGVADHYGSQHQSVGHAATGYQGGLGQGFDSSAFAGSAMSAGAGLGSQYGSDLHAAASSAKKSVSSAKQ